MGVSTLQTTTSQLTTSYEKRANDAENSSFGVQILQTSVAKSCTKRMPPKDKEHVIKFHQQLVVDLVGRTGLVESSREAGHQILARSSIWMAKCTF
jgi:hypothetical protein